MDYVVPRKVTGISVAGQYGEEDLLDPAWSGLVLESVDGLLDAAANGAGQEASMVIGVIPSPSGSASFDDNWARAERLFVPGDAIAVTVRTVRSTRQRRFFVGDVVFNDEYDYSYAHDYRSIRVSLRAIDSYWYPTEAYNYTVMDVALPRMGIRSVAEIELPPTGIPTFEFHMPRFSLADTGGDDGSGTIRPVAVAVREKGTGEAWREVVVGHPDDKRYGQVVLTTDSTKPTTTLDGIPVPRVVRSLGSSSIAPRRNVVHEIKVERPLTWYPRTSPREPMTVGVKAYGRYRFPW